MIKAGTASSLDSGGVPPEGPRTKEQRHSEFHNPNLAVKAITLTTNEVVGLLLVLLFQNKLKPISATLSLVGDQLSFLQVAVKEAP